MPHKLGLQAKDIYSYSVLQAQEAPNTWLFIETQIWFLELNLTIICTYQENRKTIYQENKKTTYQENKIFAADIEIVYDLCSITTSQESQ